MLHWVHSLAGICLPDLLLPPQFSVKISLKMLVLLQNNPRAPSRARKTYLFDAGAAKYLLNSGNFTNDWLKAKYQGWGGDGEAWMQDGKGTCLFWKHKKLIFTFWGLPAPSVLSSQGSPHYQMGLGGCRERHVFLDLCFSVSSQLGLRSQ